MVKRKGRGEGYRSSLWRFHEKGDGERLWGNESIKSFSRWLLSARDDTLFLGWLWAGKKETGDNKIGQQSVIPLSCHIKL